MSSSRTQQCSEDDDEISECSQPSAVDLQNENNPGSDSDEFSKFIEQNYSQDPADPCADRGQPSSGEFFDISSLELSQDSEFMQCVDFDYQKHICTDSSNVGFDMAAH